MMPTSSAADQTALDLEQPFPLKRMFYSRIIPGLFLTFSLLSILSFLGTRKLIEEVYLNLAKNRAESIAYNLQAQMPAVWKDFLRTHDPEPFLQQPQGVQLLEIIHQPIVDRRTARFKLYSRDRTILYDPKLENIGNYEDNPALDPVFRQGQSLVLPKPEEFLNELYIPVLNDQGQIEVVFELYEKEFFLDVLILNNQLPTLGIPLLLFVGLFSYLFFLVARAQREIDGQVQFLRSIRSKLEQFVSSGTIQAAVLSSEVAEIPPQRIATTIYYSDVRRFTSLADTSPPTEVVAYLNQVMSVQIEIIKKYQGDIDKLIGDAVMAQFDGTDGERRALQAAQEIIQTLAPQNLVRGIGIGIQSGDVLACAVGSAQRKDFTLIGDTVNLAARLCSAARKWEIVVEDRTLRHSGLRGSEFSGPEPIRVKGHDSPLEVFRWSPEALSETPDAP